MILGILLLIGSVVASLVISYLWEKWTSKKGTEQALKDSKIPKQIKQQGLDLEHLKNEGKMNLQNSMKTQNDVKEIKESIKQLIQQQSSNKEGR